MADARGASAGASRRASEYGVSSRTRAVIRASAPSVGTGIVDTDPSSSDPMYCDGPPVSPPGCGPRGLGAPPSPFPLRTNIREPSRSKMTPVGYQPTGIHPLTTLLRGVLTSATATVLLSAFATSSVRPSGESATAFGVEPAGASRPRATEICSVAVFAAGSTTHTAFVFAQATNSRLPSFERTIAFGCSPTATSPFTASDEGSSISTFAPPQTETKSVWPSGDRIQV